MRARRWAAALLGLMLVLSGCQSADAGQFVQAGVELRQSGATTEVVYVTKSGSKYHAEGCRYLRESCREISLEEARADYEPCQVCRPVK